MLQETGLSHERAADVWCHLNVLRWVHDHGCVVYMDQVTVVMVQYVSGIRWVRASLNVWFGKVVPVLEYQQCISFFLYI